MITSDAVRERWRYQVAAGRARREHPGPLGELVYRELVGYAEFGHRFGHNGLLARLVDDLLAGRADGPGVAVARGGDPPDRPVYGGVAADGRRPGGAARPGGAPGAA